MSTFRTVLVELRHNPVADWHMICELPEFGDKRINEPLLWQNPLLGSPRFSEEFPALPNDVSRRVRDIMARGAWWVTTCLSLTEFQAGVDNIRTEYPDHVRAAMVEFEGALALARAVVRAGSEVRFIVLLDY